MPEAFDVTEPTASKNWREKMLIKCVDMRVCVE